MTTIEMLTMRRPETESKSNISTCTDRSSVPDLFKHKYRSSTKAERKLKLANALTNIIKENVNLPKDAWIAFKQYLETGDRQNKTIFIPSLDKTLRIKLFSSSKRCRIYLI